MASPEVEKVISRVEREADMYDIDLDTVRKVDDTEVDADGIVVRVLETDAPDEADQVGFQIHRPPGDPGWRMFEENISKYMKELRDHLRKKRGDDPDDDLVDDSDNTLEEPTTASDEESPPQPDNTRRGEIDRDVIEHVGLEVTIDDESLSDFRDELDSLFEEMDEAFADDEEIDQLVEQMNDLDERLSQIEDRLSMLALGPQESNDE